MPKRKPPQEIHGTPVHTSDKEPIKVNGERWVTLFPVAPDDMSIWEFSLDSGRLLHMYDAEGEEV